MFQSSCQKLDVEWAVETYFEPADREKPLRTFGPVVIDMREDMASIRGHVEQWGQSFD